MEQKSKFVSNREYMANGLSADLEDFVKGGRIKSGYCNLDLITNLYPGFYVLGAVSSLVDILPRINPWDSLDYNNITSPIGVDIV